MGRIKLDQEAMGLVSFLEKITHAHVLDCFKDEDTLYFVVAQGQIGKALGKAGSNIKRIQQEIKKKVKVIEFKEDVVDFVRNMIKPLQVEEIKEEDGIVYLKDSSKKTKSLLIGRGGKNIHITNRAVKRFFDVEVKVQ